MNLKKEIDKLLTIKGYPHNKKVKNLEKYSPILYNHFLTHNLRINYENLYLIYNNINKPKCKCGKNQNFISFKQGYYKYCSKTCGSKYSRDKMKSTLQEKYNVNKIIDIPNVKEKIRNTNIKRYGNPCSLIGNKEKIKKICLKKYGVDNPSKSQEIKDKISKTILSKDIKNKEIHIIDFKNRFNIPYLISKFLLKNNIFNVYSYLNHFNVKNDFFNKRVKPKLIDNNIIKFNTDNISSGHNDICLFLDSLNIFYIINDRKELYPYELDIYIPEYKLAIEFNGLFYHSEGYSEYFKNIDKEYHKTKTILCEKKGIQLLHVFENEWIDNTKRNIWKSIIRHKLKLSNNIINARNCTIKEISSKESREFINENHLQGNINSSIRYGLYYNDKLISIMTFGKPRSNKSIEYEIYRFCVLKNYNIRGAFSKLLKHFTKIYNPKSLISYADRRYSKDSVYSNYFDIIDYTKPNFYYFNSSNKIYSRVVFQKHKLDKYYIDKKYNIIYFNKKDSAKHILLKNKYRIIYDSGNVSFIKYFI